MLESYDIHIISTITDNGSLSKAAEVLCISQSTLSKRLSRLESTLGVSLFYRHNGGMNPTPAAEYMIAQGDNIRDRLSSIDRHIKMLGALNAGNLNIGIGPIIEQVLFPELLVRYSEVTNNIRVKLISGSTERLNKLLLNGEVDVALGPFVPQYIPDNLTYSGLTRDQLVFVARAEHPIFQQAEPMPLSELKNYPSIGPDIPPNIQVNVPEGILDNIPTITCGNYTTAKSLTLSSDYITGGPQVLFQQEIDAGELKIIPGMPKLQWQSYLLLKPESEHIPSVAKFIEVLNSLPSVNRDQTPTA